jgi:chromosome partitioning protein
MQVLVLASQKGGAGKTTLALHLAVAAEAAGHGPVVLVDADPQGTLTRWWNFRAQETPKMAASSVADLRSSLKSLADGGFKLAIVDTAGRSSEANRTIIEQANLVLMPVRPSAADLWALGETVEACKQFDRPFSFAVCQATRGALLTIQTVAALSAHGAVAPVVVHSRVNYAAGLASGQTIQELEPKGPGAEEVASLWAFVQERMLEIGHASVRANQQARGAPLGSPGNRAGQHASVRAGQKASKRAGVQDGKGGVA